jgi:hypothetical protein
MRVSTYFLGHRLPRLRAAGQSGESYCKRCGEGLPNADHTLRPGLLRQWTRDEIRKMRRLKLVITSDRAET